MASVARLIPAALLVPVLASAQPGFQSPPAAFQTPSGNLHCLWHAGALRCEVLARDFAPPRDCPGGWSGALTLRTDRPVELLCGAPGVRNDEAFVLGYGARWLGPGVTCESAEGGLRCANRAGQGFQVSRARLELF